MSEATTAAAENTVVNVSRFVWDQFRIDGVNTVVNLDEFSSEYTGDDHSRKGDLYEKARKQALDLGLVVGEELIDFAYEEWGDSASINDPWPIFSREWFQWLRDYLDDQGAFSGGAVDKKVTARGWSRGGEPTLTGHKIYRLTVDARSQSMEVGTSQAIKFTVASGPGTLFRRVRVSGDDTGIDEFDLKGTARDPIEVNSIDEVNFSDQLLNNPAFVASTTSGTATSSNIPSWTFSGTWTISTSPLFRTNATVISATADGAYVEQNVSQELDPWTPYLPIAWVQPVGVNAADGFVLSWGDQSQAFVGLTNSAWNVLVPTRNNLVYPVVFDNATTGRRIRLEVDNDNAAGTFNVGALFLVPGFIWNGTWWFIIGDSVSGALDSYATVTDTLTPAGRIQHALCTIKGDDDSYFAYLNTTGTNTITDPT